MSHFWSFLLSGTFRNCPTHKKCFFYQFWIIKLKKNCYLTSILTDISLSNIAENVRNIAWQLAKLLKIASKSLPNSFRNNIIKWHNMFSNFDTQWLFSELNLEDIWKSFSAVLQTTRLNFFNLLYNLKTEILWYAESLVIFE